MENWIKANERLPELPPPYYEDGVKFTPLTSAAIVYDGEDVFTSSYDKDGFMIEGITHWMPLPKPPEGY